MSVTFVLLSQSDEFLAEDLEMNVANANAGHLLRLLGMVEPEDSDPELCGGATPDEFLGRVRNAIRCSMTQSVYTVERLCQLRDLAERGVKIDAAEVSWA
jgi:hypothetical protein